MSETNIRNQSKLKNPHTACRTSFAVIHDNLEKEKGTSSDVSQKELFVAARSRKPDQGNTDEDTITKIAEMEKVQCPEGQESIDAFATVMGPEHPGFVRLYGRGVIKTTLKKKEIVESSVTATSEMQKKFDELEDKMIEKIEIQ